MISINIYINEFGLFGNVKGKKYRVHAYERTTKYLYSFNYIPSNFDGILVGPSLSYEMMDTRKIESYKIYNLSIDGGNISELKYFIDNVLKYGNIKIFIICLDPYITRDSGLKTSQINPKQYFSTLGSEFTLRYYLEKYLEFKKGKNSKYYDSYWGYTDNTYNKKGKNSTVEINKYLQKIKEDSEYKINIDSKAYSELSEVLNKVRQNNIKILAYYYPRPKRIYETEKYKREYTKYKTEIDKLLDYNNDIIVDFNQGKFDYIRSLDSTYSDEGHLSREGANKVLYIINNLLLNN